MFHTFCSFVITYVPEEILPDDHMDLSFRGGCSVEFMNLSTHCEYSPRYNNGILMVEPTVSVCACVDWYVHHRLKELFAEMSNDDASGAESPPQAVDSYYRPGNFKDPSPIVYPATANGAVSNFKIQPNLIAILPVFKGHEEPYDDDNYNRPNNTQQQNHSYIPRYEGGDSSNFQQNYQQQSSYQQRPQQNKNQGQGPSNGQQSNVNQKFDLILSELDKSNQGTNLKFESLSKSVVNLKRQMGQLAEEVHKHEAGKLPSYPTLNPKHKPGGPDHVNMVTSLRNGKTYNNDIKIPSAHDFSHDVEDFVTNDEIIVEGKKDDNVKSDSELVNYLLKDFPKPPTQNSEATESPKVGEGGVSSIITPYPASLEKSTSARLAKKGPHSEDMQETFKQVKINLPLNDAIKQIPVYAKFLKDLCTQKRKLKATLPKKIDLTEHVNAVLSSSLPPKFKDPRAPLILVVVGNFTIKKALLDLGASINILPASLVDNIDECIQRHTPSMNLDRTLENLYYVDSENELFDGMTFHEKEEEFQMIEEEFLLSFEETPLQSQQVQQPTLNEVQEYFDCLLVHQDVLLRVRGSKEGLKELFAKMSDDDATGAESPPRGVDSYYGPGNFEDPSPIVGHEEPYAHLREFFSIANTYQVNNTTKDGVKFAFFFFLLKIKLRPGSHLSNQDDHNYNLPNNTQQQNHSYIPRYEGGNSSNFQQSYQQQSSYQQRPQQNKNQGQGPSNGQQYNVDQKFNLILSELAKSKLGVNLKFKSLSKSVVNFERQMGQLAEEVQKREAGKLPSNPTLNPKLKPSGPKHVNMVTSLRNGKPYNNDSKIPSAHDFSHDVEDLVTDDEIIVEAGRSTKISKGILEDVIVKVDDFYYLVDFFVMDTESPYKDVQPNIILGRPFLATIDARINCQTGTMDIAFGNRKLRLNVFNSFNYPILKDCYHIDTINECIQTHTLRMNLDRTLENLHYVDSENELFDGMTFHEKEEEFQMIEKEFLLSFEEMPLKSQQVQQPTLNEVQEYFDCLLVHQDVLLRARGSNEDFED
nr:hypothetical protein [Tanacetum cinerariifolium]